MVHDCYMCNKLKHTALPYFSIVPGPPANLVAEPSLVDCTQTTLRWSPPVQDEQNGTVPWATVKLR